MIYVIIEIVENAGTDQEVTASRNIAVPSIFWDPIRERGETAVYDLLAKIGEEAEVIITRASGRTNLS